jgi:hypothetical protein
MSVGLFSRAGGRMGNRVMPTARAQLPSRSPSASVASCFSSLISCAEAAFKQRYQPDKPPQWRARIGGNQKSAIRPDHQRRRSSRVGNAAGTAEGRSSLFVFVSARCARKATVCAFRKVSLRYVIDLSWRYF